MTSSVVGASGCKRSLPSTSDAVAVAVPLKKKSAAFSVDALLSSTDKTNSTNSSSKDYGGHSSIFPSVFPTTKKDSPGTPELKPLLLDKAQCSKHEEDHISSDDELNDTQDSHLDEGSVSPGSAESNASKLSPIVKTYLHTSGNSDALSSISCHLEGADLWAKFHGYGTEMIITKTGRRMFPTIRVQVLGAERHCKYLVYVDIVPVDNKRYRYAYHRSSWMVAGKADPAPAAKLYLHPDSPFTGEQLASKQIISFEKAKLTNSEEKKQLGMIILNSMHKYQPRIHIVKRADGKHIDTVGDLQAHGEQYKTFIFEETQFTAVTAYQNQLITKLKIDSNPFAKGFRDSTRMADDAYGDPSFYGRMHGASFPSGLYGTFPFPRQFPFPFPPALGLLRYPSPNLPPFLSPPMSPWPLLSPNASTISDVLLQRIRAVQRHELGGANAQTVQESVAADEDKHDDDNLTNAKDVSDETEFSQRSTQPI